MCSQGRGKRTWRASSLLLGFLCVTVSFAPYKSQRLFPPTHEQLPLINHTTERSDYRNEIQKDEDKRTARLVEDADPTLMSPAHSLGDVQDPLGHELVLLGYRHAV